MHITVRCPDCYTRYQLLPEMQGRPMRCTNPVCRTVFTVEAEVETKEESIYPVQPFAPGTKDSQSASPPPERASWSGSVGDLVPILEAEEIPQLPPPAIPAPAVPSSGSAPDVVPMLPAELAGMPAVEAPREAPSWHQPPPVRKRRALGDDAEQPTAPIPAKELAVPPRQPPELVAPPPPVASPSRPEVAPAARETPRPRKKTTKMRPAPAEEPLEGPAQSWESPPVRRPPDRESGPGPVPPDWLPPVLETDSAALQMAARRRTLWVIAGLTGLVAGLVTAAVFITWSRWHKTEGDLLQQARREYREAKYASSAKTFGILLSDFPQSENLSLYQFFAELCAARNLVYSSEQQPEEASEKLTVFVEERLTDPLLKQHLVDVWETYLKAVDGLAALAERKHDRRLLALAGATLERARKLGIPDRSKFKTSEDGIVRTEANLGRWELLQRLLVEGQDLLGQPTDEAVQGFRQRLQSAKLDQEGEVKALLGQLEDGVRRAVRYVEAPKGPTPEPQEDMEPSLLAVPLVDGPKPQPPANDRVFLALARGVLYALSQSNGELLWATRVGIDSASLPVRLPLTPTSPEMVLVVSAERNTLRALDARSGQSIWQHELESPCLGRPVLVRNRVYVPTYDGKVHEIEIVEGRRLGYFQLGQPMTIGGAWQEGTDLVYFPGDSRNVYVLSIAEGHKDCVAILKSGHPSGSLRSEPIIINRFDSLARVAANQNVVHPSYLVLSQADGLRQMKLQVFQLPIQQAETAPVLLPEPRVPGWSWFQPYHDAEKLAFATDAGMLGLFGINQVNNQDTPLYRELKEDYPLGGETSQPQRAQVVHADEQDFWVLAHGELQHFQLDRFNQRMIPLWSQPLRLGLPLHASQADETGNVLFVVTQSLLQQGCLATAVEAGSGRILWQRQLGLDIQGDPFVLGNEVLAVDRAGSLFVFDSRQAPRSLNASWQEGGRLVAGPPEDASLAPLVLSSGDGTGVYTLASADRGRRLIVRRWEVGQRGNPVTLPSRDLLLPEALAGTPAVTTDRLLLPLANAQLQRYRLPLDGSPGEGGLDWRDPRADEGAPGHVVPFREDEYLFTDGSNGLHRLRWGKGPDPKRVKDVYLPARIVAAPVVLPRANAEEEVQVCVADANNVVTLLRGPELVETRHWRLEGKITAGPFLRGQRIACVVDQLHLVWLDPAKKEPLWQYTMQAKGVLGIVGQPQLVGDLILVADLSGRFVALDPATGQPRGRVYTLQAGAAPTATPVAYGPEHAFVPLSDGTIFLLPLAFVRD